MFLLPVFFLHTRKNHDKKRFESAKLMSGRNANSEICMKIKSSRIRRGIQKWRHRIERKTSIKIIIPAIVYLQLDLTKFNSNTSQSWRMQISKTIVLKVLQNIFSCQYTLLDYFKLDQLIDWQKNFVSVALSLALSFSDSGTEFTPPNWVFEISTDSRILWILAIILRWLCYLKS